MRSAHRARPHQAETAAALNGTVKKEAELELRLYVAGQSPQSLAAFANLKRLCEANLAGKYRIEVVDLLQNPQLSRDDQIVAIPTLVRRLPPPMKKIIGDLSNAERTLVGLQLRPARSRHEEH